MNKKKVYIWTLSLFVVLGLASSVFFFSKKEVPVERTKEKKETITESKIPSSMNAHLFSIYLKNKEDGKYIEIKKPMYSKNPSKIQVLEVLFSLRDSLPNGIENPIPKDVKVKSLYDKDGLVVVTLSDNFKSIPNQETLHDTVQVIATTLHSFKGVEKVQVQSKGYRSPIITKKDLKISPNKKYASTVEEECTCARPNNKK